MHLQAGSDNPHRVYSPMRPRSEGAYRSAVEVRSGPAHFRLEAIAESSARNGDMVELRNPSNGTFKARLDAGPKAVLVIVAGQNI